jgi:hypothetical protein
MARGLYKDELERAKNPVGYAIKKGLGGLLKGMPENASAYGDVAMESNPDVYDNAAGLPIPAKTSLPEAPVMEKGTVTIPPTTTLPVTTPAKSIAFDLNKSHAGDIYAALRDPKAINDKQFKKFVELHGEELPGIGFIEDAKTGKITRVASKPEPPPGMNVTQANAAANMITAQAHAKTAELGLAERKVQDTEKAEQKNLENFYKIHGRPIYNTDGKQEGYNSELTIWDAFHAGAKDKIPKSELPILDKVGLKWKDFWDTALANEKWASAYKKNKSATERALKDSFRNYLAKSYSSNPE